MKIYRHLILVLALALLLPAVARPARAAQAPGAPDMAAIDRYVAEQLERLGVPGASLGIVHEGRIVHLQGFGRADHTGRPMTPQTPTMIGSLAKSFTAYLEYWERYAETWEFQALTRARAVAGDEALGRRLCSFAEDFAYPEYLPVERVAEIRRMRERIEQERVRPPEAARLLPRRLHPFSGRRWLHKCLCVRRSL